MLFKIRHSKLYMVLMDIEMPGINEIEAAIIKENFPKIASGILAGTVFLKFPLRSQPEWLEKSYHHPM